MTKYLLIYHQEDNDGVLSAAIMKKWIVETLKQPSSEIKLFPATYGRLNNVQESKEYLEWPNQYDTVIMTDISFNDAKMMKWLYKTYKDKFIWIDHHAPIIKESTKLDFDEAIGIRRTDHSAIWCMYKFLYDPLDTEKVPLTVRMLSAWDSWTYDAEHIDQDFCRMFNKGITLVSNLKVSWWIKNYDLLDIDVTPETPKFNEIYKTGKHECELEDARNVEMIRTNGDPTWTVNGIPAIMVATTGSTNSLMFKSLQVMDPSETDLRIAVVMKHCKDGNWTVSLYNIYDFNGNKSNPLYFHCGEYLHEKYNGGGHEGAAGCTLSVKQFCKAIKSKSL